MTEDVTAEQPVEAETLPEPGYGSMIALDRKSILSKVKPVKERLHWVSCFGGGLYVIAMSGTEKDEFEQSFIAKQGKETRPDMRYIRAKTFIAGVRDAEGNKMFSDTDIHTVGELDAKDLDRVLKKFQELNSFSDDDLEELAKN